jgi:hypothetical protein
MKRLMLVLAMTLLVGACGESTTDVATRNGGNNGDGEFVPPDTIIKTEDATARVYGAGNPVALQEVTALATGGSLGGALDIAGTFGYDFDPARVAVARLRLDDGRDAVLALGMLSGGTASPGVVVYARVGDREQTLPLRLTDTGSDGFDVMTIADKTATRPDGVWWYFPGWLHCLASAMGDIMACVRNCSDCWAACVQLALVKLAICLRFTML